MATVAFGDPRQGATINRIKDFYLFFSFHFFWRSIRGGKGAFYGPETRNFEICVCATPSAANGNAAPRAG